MICIRKVSEVAAGKRLAFGSVLFIVFLFSGCYKEYIIYPDENHGIFNFMVTPEQEDMIINSRGIRYTIDNPLPILHFGEEVYGVDRFQVRGETTLSFRRKSFSVNLDDNIVFFIESEGRAKEFEEFKLISLVFDYTYIENCIALGIFHKLSLWPMHSFYTEVQLSNDTQGIYLFIEDPVEYYLYQQNASFILRRNYNHSIDNYHINDLNAEKSSEYYIDNFNSIYSLIADYSGQALYDSLMCLMDLPQYFRKIAVDLLVQNGDYTDEIFFYTKRIEDNEIFGIYPWDYDDLFSELPHEVGRSWGPGTVFGTRYYYSMDDIYADVGHKLLFSIEDDLDYKIAKDEYLYQQYLQVLEQVLEIIDIESIDEIIADTKNQLQPFYRNADIIAQSQYDDKETNQQLFENNLADKHQFLLDRREFLLQELALQKK